MNRRELLTALGAAAALPASTRAQQSTQQPALPLIGFLSGASALPFTQLVAAFRQGLGDTGFVEGQNVAIEYRWAENRSERLPEMANELVRRRVTVLVASGGDRAALAAQAASATIPIVFSAGGDPVANGLVASLGRPGANLTGVSLLTTLLEAKRLSLLREALPAATRIGLLVNPGGAVVQSMVQESELPRAAWACAWWWSRPTPRASSSRPSRACCNSAPTHWWSSTARSSTAGASSWWRWRRATSCPPSTSSVSSHGPVV